MFPGRVLASKPRSSCRYAWAAARPALLSLCLFVAGVVAVYSLVGFAGLCKYWLLPFAACHVWLFLCSRMQRSVPEVRGDGAVHC